MPSVPIHPPANARKACEVGNPLPSVLHTPSGLALIEIQGSINILAHNVLDALQLGHLLFPSADDEDPNGEWDGKRVILLIGEHQRMAGEVKKLAEPVAVLRRRPGHENPAIKDEVEIAEIVYHKVLFAHRPEPVGTDQQETALDEQDPR